MDYPKLTTAALLTSIIAGCASQDITDQTYVGEKYGAPLPPLEAVLAPSIDCPAEPDGGYFEHKNCGEGARAERPAAPERSPRPRARPTPTPEPKEPETPVLCVFRGEDCL